MSMPVADWRALSPKFPFLLQCISPREKKGTRRGEGTEEEEEEQEEVDPPEHQNPNINLFILHHNILHP